MSLITLYDTTLRDGTQAEDIAFLLEDKIRIAHKLDEIGIHYIEGGWPGSNPKDVAFFKDIKKEKLSKSKIAAFGSTRRAKVTPDKDQNIRTLVQAEGGGAGTPASVDLQAIAEPNGQSRLKPNCC